MSHDCERVHTKSADPDKGVSLQCTFQQFTLLTFIITIAWNWAHKISKLAIGKKLAIDYQLARH